MCVILRISVCLELYDTLVHFMNNTGRCVGNYYRNISNNINRTDSENCTKGFNLCTYVIEGMQKLDQLYIYLNVLSVLTRNHHFLIVSQCHAGTLICQLHVK